MSTAPVRGSVPRTADIRCLSASATVRYTDDGFRVFDEARPDAVTRLTMVEAESLGAQHVKRLIAEGATELHTRMNAFLEVHRARAATDEERLGIHGFFTVRLPLLQDLLRGSKGLDFVCHLAADTCMLPDKRIRNAVVASCVSRDIVVAANMQLHVRHRVMAGGDGAAAYFKHPAPFGVFFVPADPTVCGRPFCGVLLPRDAHTTAGTTAFCSTRCRHAAAPAQKMMRRIMKRWSGVASNALMAARQRMAAVTAVTTEEGAEGVAE